MPMFRFTYSCPVTPSNKPDTSVCNETGPRTMGRRERKRWTGTGDMGGGRNGSWVFSDESRSKYNAIIPASQTR